MNGLRAFTVPMIIAGVLLAAAFGSAEEAQHLRQPPAGFTAKGPVAFYDRGNLYEYIDGQAVFYLSYGFTRLEHGIYLKDGGTYTVDVYELNGPLSTFGAFRQQREEDAEKLAAGVEGSILNYLTMFFKDKYYIEIIPETEGSDDMAAMRELAEWIDGVLPGEKSLPPELSLFPTAGLTPNSERYVDESLISYSFMGRGLTALYKEPGQSKEMRVFIAFAPDSDKANEIFDGFKGKMSNTQAVMVGDIDGVKGELPYRGASIACRYGAFVYGCMGVADEKKATALLSQLGENLVKYSRKQ